MRVPLLDLAAQHEPIHKDLLAAIEDVLAKSQFILGDEVARLERRIAEYCGTRHGVGVSSGTDALLATLLALDVKPGDEVITSPLSFFATAGAIVRSGAKPVFVDVNPGTYNIDPDRVKASITRRTRAIIPVHLYGQCADMAPILDVAVQSQVAVVEDAAQAIGAQYKDGRRAGNMGSAGCLSFFPSKNLGGLGDGGMVVTNDDELAERLRVLRVQGAKPKYYHRVVGGNFRLDTVQAAALNVKMPYLDRWTALRQQHANLYGTLFRQGGLDERIRIRLPATPYRDSGVAHYHVYNQFVIAVPDRDGLREHLRAAGVGTEVYYPVPLHRQEALRHLGYKQGDCPVAEQLCCEVLAIPIYPELSETQQEYVVQSIAEFYEPPRTTPKV